MNNKEKYPTDKPGGEELDVVVHNEENMQKDEQGVPEDAEIKLQEESIRNKLEVEEQSAPKAVSGATEYKGEESNQQITDERGEPPKPETDETEKRMDELEVPKMEELDTGSEVQSDVTEDPDKEKKEKEEKVMSNYKSLAFPKRPRSMIKSELLVKEVKKFIEDMKRQTAPEDLDFRIIPSNMACRFDLPIDLTRLKGECPLSYLRMYCQVTDSRKTVYREKFEQYKLEQTIKVSNLRKIYENLYRVSGLQDEVMHLQRLLCLDLSMELDMETFTVVSCLMERIMLKSQGRGPAQGYKKNIFEVTNFSALNGKLQGTEITPQMMDLLKYIRGT